MQLLKFLGSLAFALFLLTVLTVILIISTSMEGAYGTPFAQRFFYQAGWFDVLLALVGVNLIASAITRWPYKKYHTGFVVTHVGIVLVLIGSLLSRLYGVDGQMMLQESEQKNDIRLSGYEFTAHMPDHATQTFTLKGNTAGRSYPLKNTGLKIRFHQVLENAGWKTELAEGASSDPINPGIHFKLESQMLGQSQEQWLVQKNPFDPESNRLHLGPAVVEIKEKRPVNPPSEPVKKPEPAQAVVTHAASGESVSIPLDKLPAGPVTLGKSGLKIGNIRYFPDARVNDEMKLVSVSDQALNPAVELTLVDSKGVSETHTRFAQFPDFDSLHGKKRENNFGIRLEITGAWENAHGRHHDHGQPMGPSLSFHPGASWTFTSTSKKGSSDGAVEVNQPTATGWMDMQFTALKFFERAVVRRQMIAGAGSLMAAEVSLSGSGWTSPKTWVSSDDAAMIETPSGSFVMGIGQTSKKVPFNLTLKDFRKVDYPGTRNAMEYESDVILEDPAERFKIEKTISMNKPLDYKGYRIFQSSFIQDERWGEASVFTVAKNPGIDLIYGGCIILFTGVILLFYVAPLSSFSVKKK